MKDSLLLLMTPNMSLEKWNKLGQLSREMNYYRELCKAANLKLLIYSYGRDDFTYVKDDDKIEVLCMPPWIPSAIPYRLQNLVYNLSSLIIFRKHLKKVVLAKTNQYSASTFGALLKLILRIPLTIRMGFYHSHFKKIGFISRLQEWFMFSICDLILTTSAEARRFIISRYNVPPKKILSMCNTLDLNLFKPAEGPKEIDLIFVGRLDKVKNIELMLAVLNKVKLKTLLIGSGPLDHLVRIAVKHNSKITWKERVDNIELPVYYNKAKCFIIFSEYEGNPKALLEAMACGVAGIGTNVHGIKECIVHNINGILTDAAEDTLVAAVNALFSDEPKLKVMGNNAAQWAVIHCDMLKNIERELSFYSAYLNAGELAYSN